jgi:tetratricopeptide (TPR) repeat protein
MKLFMSYPRKDRPKVDKLVHVLEQGGQVVWIDDQLKVGQPWRQQLADAIEDADGIVLALTPNWIASPYCQWEFITAVEMGKKIIPVLLDDTEDIPDRISQYQYANFIDGFDDDAKVQKFINDLANLGTIVAAEASDKERKEVAAAQITQEIKTGDISNSKVNVAQNNQAGRGSDSTTTQGNTSQSINLGNVSDSSNINITQNNIGQVISNNRGVFALLVVVLLVLIPLGIFTVLSPEQQANIQYGIGLIDASDTPTPTPTTTLTPSPTLTPTPTVTPTATPSLQQFEIGIAVAYFYLPDDSVDVLEADGVVEQIIGRVNSEITGIEDATGLNIGLLQPTDIDRRRIEGETASEREDDARSIAEAYDADIVLYGVITRDDNNNLEVVPEFYVLPETFFEALEMTGSFVYGRSITVEGPLSRIRTAMQINRPLSERTTSIVQTFAGLIHYLLEDYDAALASFEEAATISEWDENNTDSQLEGKEVVHVLLGNTVGKLASVAAQNGDRETALERADAAIEQYQQAIDIAPEYARPYVGIASATYLRWTVLAQDPTLYDEQGNLLPESRETLDEAQSYINQIDRDFQTSDDIGIQTKELFIQLQISYAQWAFYELTYSFEDHEALYNDILSLVERIERNYDNGRNSSVQESIAEAYALRGLVNQQRFLLDDAIENYDLAIEIHYSNRRKMIFTGWKGDAYYFDGQTEEALAAYEEALRLADIVGDVADFQVEYYQTQISSLQPRG